MQMVGQHADRNGFEWITLLNGSVDVSEMVDVTNEEIACSIGDRNGEEKRAASNSCTSISRHERKLS
jgi:hypothetical protein